MTSLLTAVECPDTNCRTHFRTSGPHGLEFEDMDEKGDRCMRTMRRIRNVAFLLLVVALAGTSQAKLSADDGGFFCGYGDCVLTYDNCEGTWEDYYYPDSRAGNEPGDCFIIYHAVLTFGGSCYINLDDEGLYTWSVPGEDCSGTYGQGAYCFACVQQ